MERHNNNNTRLTALFPGLPRWAGTRKVKPIWILLKQDTVSGSGISWAICKSADRQITMPAPHRWVFLQPSRRPPNSVKALNARNKNVPKIVVKTQLIYLLPCIIFEKYIYILALEMASAGNRHCANCVGVLSLPSWWRSTVAKRRSLTGELSLPCARPAADGWPLMLVNRPLQVSQLGQLSLSSFLGR